MSDWAAVVLVLGLCALAVAVYGVRAMVGVRSAVLDVASLRSALDARASQASGFDDRLKRIEVALKLDGQRITAEAARNALPAMMR